MVECQPSWAQEPDTTLYDTYLNLAEDLTVDLPAVMISTDLPGTYIHYLQVFTSSYVNDSDINSSCDNYIDWDNDFDSGEFSITAPG